MIKDMLTGIISDIAAIKSRLDNIPRLEKSKNNYEATAAPAVTDDVDAGYTIGSTWINITAKDAYILCDSTVGAAVWKKISP